MAEGLFLATQRLRLAAFFVISSATLSACGATLLVVSDGGRESASEAWSCRIGSGASASAQECERAETAGQLQPQGLYRRAYVAVQQNQDEAASHLVRVNFRSTYIEAPEGICAHGVHRTDLILKRSGKAKVLFECALPEDRDPIGPPP